MKKVCLVIVAVGLLIATIALASEKLELVTAYQGFYGPDKPYKAYVYGEWCKTEIPIKQHEGCLVSGGCVPDDYLRKNVNVYYYDSYGHLVPYTPQMLAEGHPVLGFGEVMHIFQETTWTDDNKWKGWKIQKIVVYFDKK